MPTKKHRPEKWYRKNLVGIKSLKKFCSFMLFNCEAVLKADCLIYRARNKQFNLRQKTIQLRAKNQPYFKFLLRIFK